MTWRGKNVIHTGSFKDNQCVGEEFAFVDGRAMKQPDFDRFAAPYDGKLFVRRTITNENGIFRLLEDKAGKVTTVLAYLYKGNSLMIVTLDVWHNYFEGKTATLRNAPDTTTDAVTAVQPSTEATPEPDCLIVATEIHARLKSVRALGENRLLQVEHRGFGAPRARNRVIPADIDKQRLYI